MQWRIKLWFVFVRRYAQIDRPLRVGGFDPEALPPTTLDPVVWPYLAVEIESAD